MFLFSGMCLQEFHLRFTHTSKCRPTLENFKQQRECTSGFPPQSRAHYAYTSRHRSGPARARGLCGACQTGQGGRAWDVSSIFLTSHIQVIKYKLSTT